MRLGGSWATHTDTIDSSGAHVRLGEKDVSAFLCLVVASKIGCTADTHDFNSLRVFT